MTSTAGMETHGPTGTSNITMATTEAITQKPSVFTGEVISVLYTLIGCVGVIGNLLVICVIISSKKLRKKFINMLIANQSCIDAVVSILLIGIATLTTSNVPYQGIGGDIYCLFWVSRTFLFGLLLSSTYNLVCLTLERYAEVVHPIWHRNYLSLRKIQICIIFVWVFFPLLQGSITWSTTYVKDGRCFINARWPNSRVRQFYGIMNMIFKLFIPLIVLIFVYGRIAYVLHKRIQVNKIQAINNAIAQQPKEDKMSRGRKNTVKTMFLVSVSFLLCWVWNQVYFFLQNVGLPADFSSNFYHFTVLMVYLNSTINPFIYCLKYEQFQNVAKRLFCRHCLYGRGQVGDSFNIDNGPTSINTQTIS